jgi:hypothetical protein
MTDPARWSPVRSRIWGLFSLVFFCQLARGTAGAQEFLMSGALKPTDIERGRTGFNCTLCGDCLASCRQASIAYRFPGLSAETARRLFLVLVVSLHAVFLGVARM